jgi:tRNA(His) 5'-end guanylyltransferase
MNLGDRMKEYEAQTTSQKLIKGLPVVCRLDGRSFHTFTKGLERPFDIRFVNLMASTAKYLLEETNANIVYTQSDEISLIYYTEDCDSQMIFDGKVFKMTSVIAAMATGYFNKHISDFLPEKSHYIPVFDCRVFNVPNLDEAVNAILWRERDATKNSITMAANHYYSDKQLHGKNGSEKQEMLFQKGINWNDYPSAFKRGVYIQRKRIMTKFSTEELEKLPKKHQARLNPDLEIERWVTKRLESPPLSTISNKIDVIIYGKDYILNNEKTIDNYECE